MPIAGAWGDLVNTLLTNRQQLQENDLHMQDQAMNILLKKQGYEIREREDQANRAVLSNFLQGSQAQGDTSLDIKDDDTPITVAQKTLKQAQREATQGYQLAGAITKAGGSISLAERYLSDARMADRRVLDAQRELRLQQKEQSARMSDIAGSARDEASFQSALSQMRTEAPDMVKTLNFDRDATGAPVWGNTTAQTMSTVAESGMTTAQKIDRQIKFDDEKRKIADEQRKIDDDKRKAAESNARIAKLQQDVKSGKALEDKRTQETEAAKAKAERAKTIAEAKPTPTMRADAEASIKAAYPDEKFDSSSLQAFAGDVAARANKLVAEALSKGYNLSLDDARQQAIGELDQFSSTGTKTHWFSPDEHTRTYSRGRDPSKAPEKAAEKPAAPGKPTGAAVALPTGSMEEVRKALVVDQIYDTKKGRVRWDGSRFIPVAQ